jgi:hypothetical protein
MTTIFTDMTNIATAESVYAHYGLCSIWHFDDVCSELGIERHQIKEYFVKWDQLVLTYIDDDGVEHQEHIDCDGGAASDYDFKRPHSVEVE